MIQTNVVLLPSYAVAPLDPLQPILAASMFTVYQRDILLVQILSFVNVSRGQKMSTKDLFRVSDADINS